MTYKLPLWVLTALLALGLAQQSAIAVPKGKKPGKQPSAQPSFTDHLQFMEPSRWTKADGWANGPPFDNAWRADNVAFEGGDMQLRLDDTPMLGEPYTSGEYRTNGFYGYGCYEVSMKPPSSPGLVSSFFTFAGPWDDGGNGRHNEIDIEFPGTTDAVQFNFWTNDDSYSSANEILFPLTFDASADFHAYGFKWTSQGISWYVDGNLAYEAFDTALNPTPKASESLQKIMMNLWAVDETAEGWAGTFEYPGRPLVATYEWVRFTAGEDCQVGLSLPSPEPEVPAQGLYVAAVELTLNQRGNQAIARVTVLDEHGVAADAALVSGSWSGAVERGDTRRETDADGMAVFYSAGFRSQGEVHFCVTGVGRADAIYDSDANLATCGMVGSP